MQLRYYQIEAKKQTYEAMRQGVQNILLQLPTGGGKTVIFNSIIKDGVDAKKRLLVLAHRSELIQQAADKLYKAYQISPGIIMSGYPTSAFNMVQIASVQTLIRRSLVKPPDLVIIDEAHHMQADNTYGKIKNMILETNPNCRFLGVTATPCRTNGSGFKGVFDILIQGTSIPELISNGFLTPPRYYVAPLELKGIKISAGDYNLKELSEEYQKRVHPIDLVDNWKKLANGAKTIGFAVDIQHSLSIVEEFKKHGIKAAHIDGTSKEDIRKRTIKAFEKDDIQVLYNVGVFDEGFDVPAIEAVQLARPTKSLIKYMQMVGRALRPANGKDFAIVLDHAGLVAEHDIVERERIWTLEGVEKKKSNKETAFRDKETGKIYKPEQLPLDLPMQRIELILLTTQEQRHAVLTAKMERRFLVLAEQQKRNNYNPFWVWFRMAEKVKSSQKQVENLQEIADYFCKYYDYPPYRAKYIVDNYLNNPKHKLNKGA